MTGQHASRLTRRSRAYLATLLVVLATSVLSLVAYAAPASPNIILEVHDHASSGSDGFTNTTASNGATYSYRYSGGENDTGDVIFRSRGRVTVNVSLDNGNRYSIQDVSFNGDAYQQLSWLNAGSQGSRAVIQDINDQQQTAQYKVVVMDEESGATIPCDPIIANRG